MKSNTPTVEHPGRSSAGPKPTLRISATILTRNSAALLDRVLTALHWCDEVVIFDTGSTDDTRALAASFPNVALHELRGEFPGFGLAHRQATALARNDWILSVDSDEVVSPELREELSELLLDPGAVYSMPFRNYFNGRHITTCGWYPDRHVRLFNRRVTNFSNAAVHEQVERAGLTERRLRNPIHHYSYRSAEDFLQKMTAYAALFAEQNCGKKKANVFKATTRSGWAFFKSYGLELGCTQGTEGLMISAYKAQTVFWKYLMLEEANRRADRLSPSVVIAGVNP